MEDKTERPNQVIVRLSDLELARVNQLLEDAEMTRAAWFRQLIKKEHQKLERRVAQ